MHQGSCLCGGVRYTLDAELASIQLCHCSRCRKASGTAFATNSPVPAEKFSLQSGAALLREYESSPGKFRAFCSRCGAPVYSRAEQLPGVLRLRLGSFDTPVARRPDFHFYVDSKADWYEIGDALPQYPGARPPG